jgi:hypothetical protein
MTLPKGSRSLHHNGKDYRFKVSRADMNLRVVVEDVAHPGHVVLAIFDHRRCPGVGPAEVKAFISYAIDAGWSPGSMSNFAMSDTSVDEALVAIGR